MKTDSADFDLKQFESLCSARELAAIHCVSAIQFVLCVFEAQDFEQARQILAEALSVYKRADQTIANFHLSRIQQAKREKEKHANGNANVA